MRNQRAVTLVEIIVAVVVFSIGALGSAAVLANAARAHSLANARRDAVNAMRAVSAALTTRSCAAPVAGDTLIGGVRVEWTTTVTDSVAHLALHATHRGTSSVLRTEFPCP